MTTREAFTAAEWAVLKRTVHEPGVAVILASPGGALREILALAQGVIEALNKFAGCELVMALLKETEIQDTEHHLPSGSQSFMDAMIGNLRAAVQIVKAKATPAELADYQALVLFMAEKIANASVETGTSPVTADEQRVLDEIKLALHRPA